MTKQEAEGLLQTKFKLKEFYAEQWETIEKILKGERVLLIEKTGFGKSLCFQFPAIVFSGTTVVFSPLIALMRDQVKSYIPKSRNRQFTITRKLEGLAEMDSRPISFSFIIQRTRNCHYHLLMEADLR